jgi:hypothetical protein
VEEEGRSRSATVMFCRNAQSTVDVARSVGQCRGTEGTGEVRGQVKEVWTLA